MSERSFQQFQALPVAVMLFATVMAHAVTGQEPVSDLATVPIANSPTFEIAVFDPQSAGWNQLGAGDFERVNGDDQTLVFTGYEALGSGTPIGVTRTKKQYVNFEMVIDWMHLKPAGNSGVFAWVPAAALEGLPPNKLPNSGIEVQMLDHDYARQYRERSGKEPTWFTSNGDVFAVGKSSMKPFEPLSPNGSRSFPTQQTTHGSGQWNRYYIRGINGEIRLWVNGVEVSGGRDCSPSEGYLCLESEGSPIRFRNIWVRELP
ncbi:protein of unknown function [Neorhodopirellula lusitana]|uniref:3-keto-alpha-glucoside-1,2-lyase/3-keto-2-hydroxy-glucal hydratase domain-containing protein n=1 Tax=Neorhodopirellula lusitana TaxID=445327 RepID=A0ABY1QLX9_9BACT|nr:DUF1080 domain-containing protein [Neorhodopirellula lusitana]SMP74910.1 protein of unknown function [Neorhodopirellula lusitana]